MPESDGPKYCLCATLALIAFMFCVTWHSVSAMKYPPRPEKVTLNP